MYYSRLIAERIVQGDKGQRNGEIKALDKYFPCDSSSVCTPAVYVLQYALFQGELYRMTKVKEMGETKVLNN